MRGEGVLGARGQPGIRQRQAWVNSQGANLRRERTSERGKLSRAPCVSMTHNPILRLPQVACHEEHSSRAKYRMTGNTSRRNALISLLFGSANIARNTLGRGPNPR